MPAIPKVAPSLSSVAIPALAAALWSGVMALAADEPAATQRSLVFLGGPLLLLAGLHARLHGFLHAPDRMRWLPLPIVALRHWQAGARAHLPSFALATVLGAAALLLGLPSRPTARAVPSDLALVVEFCWFAILAGLLEPLASALAAWLGRRFPEHGRAHELQRSLGGGWTTPEAVVHLYAPAFALSLAVLLAMPGQLTWERWIDGHALDPGLLVAALAPVAVALGVRAWSPRAYCRGFWEAVPWLAEATRTLAGPPTPEASPGWIRSIPSPWLRLIFVQFWRMTPLPYLRLAAVIGLTIYTILREDPPTGPSVAVAVAAIGLWLVPASSLARGRVGRTRLCGALPLSRPRRRGRVGAAAGLALACPALALLAALAARAIRLM